MSTRKRIFYGLPNGEQSSESTSCASVLFLPEIFNFTLRLIAPTQKNIDGVLARCSLVDKFWNHSVSEMLLDENGWYLPYDMRATKNLLLMPIEMRMIQEMHRKVAFHNAAHLIDGTDVSTMDRYSTAMRKLVLQYEQTICRFVCRMQGSIRCENVLCFGI